MIINIYADCTDMRLKSGTNYKGGKLYDYTIKNDFYTNFVWNSAIFSSNTDCDYRVNNLYSRKG